MTSGIRKTILKRIMRLNDVSNSFIAALPPRTADLLTAIDIQGQSQKAYAESRGMSYSTLKSQVQSGRAALRSIFENCCHLTLDVYGNVSDYRSKSDGCDNC